MKDLNDKEEMNFSGFIGNLKTHEMVRKVRVKKEPQKKKSVAFKITPSILEDEEIMDKDEEEEFAMLVRKVRKMFYK